MHPKILPISTRYGLFSFLDDRSKSDSVKLGLKARLIAIGAVIITNGALGSSLRITATGNVAQAFSITNTLQQVLCAELSNRSGHIWTITSAADLRL